MKLINHDQRSLLWHQWRRTGIGASESGSIAASIGLLSQPASWMGTIQSIWEEKVGLRPHKKTHHSMSRGAVYENDAVDLYFSKTNNLTSPICGEMDANPHVIASFDGLGFDRMVILETKVPGAETIELACNGVVEPCYEPQAAHQCLVAWGHPDQWPAGAEHHFFAYQPETNIGHLVARPASQYKLLAEKLLPEIDKLWECIEKRIAPCGDAWLQAAIKYRIIKAQLDILKSLEEEAKEDLLKYFPNGLQKSFSGGGVTATKSQKAGSIKYAEYVESIKAPEAELEKFRGESSDSVRLTIEKKKAPPIMSDAVQLALSMSNPVDEKTTGDWIY